MKLKSFINKLVNKAEVEAYCFAYIKYRKIVLDVLMFLFLLFPLIFGLKWNVSYMFLMGGFMIALIRLEQTIFELVKENAGKHQKKLTENSALEEVNKILKKDTK